MQKLTLALFGATGGTGSQLLTRALDRGFHLSRADLADFLLDEMERPRYRRQAVGLSDRRPAPAPVPA